MTESPRKSRAHAVDVEAVQMLANETHRPVAEVQAIFEAEFEQLKREAHITDFLVLFACRRTRARLSPERLS